MLFCGAFDVDFAESFEFAELHEIPLDAHIWGFTNEINFSMKSYFLLEVL